MKELDKKLQDMMAERATATPEQLTELMDAALEALSAVAAMDEDVNRRPGRIIDKVVRVRSVKALVLTTLTRNDEDFQRRKAVRRAVAEGVTNALNYPERLSHLVLGTDMSDVIDAVTERVLRVLSTESAKTEPEKEEPVRGSSKEFRFVTLDDLPSGTLSETEAWQKLSAGEPLGYIQQYNPDRGRWEDLGMQKPPEFEFRVAHPSGYRGIRSGADALAMVKQHPGAIVQTRVKGSGDPWVDTEQ